MAYSRRDDRKYRVQLKDGSIVTVSAIEASQLIRQNKAISVREIGNVLGRRTKVMTPAQTLGYKTK